MPSDITSVTPAVCALFGIPAPALAQSGAPAWLPTTALARPVQRMLVYAPDAIGKALLLQHPRELGSIKELAPL